MAYTRPAPGDPGNSGPTSATTIIDALSDGLERLEARDPWVSARDYGIINDGYSAVVTLGSGTNPTLTLTSSIFSFAGFSASDVGKAVHVGNGNTGADSWFRSTITSYISASQVVLSGTPTNPGTGKHAIIGTDNATAINALFAALTVGQKAHFPGGEGFYFSTGSHQFNTTRGVLCGDGRGATRFVSTSATGTLFTAAPELLSYRPPDQEIHSFSVWHGAYYGWSAASLPTAGAGLAITEATGVYWNGLVSNVEVNGFYNGAAIQVPYSEMDRCAFNSSVNAGLLIDSPNFDGGLARITRLSTEGSTYAVGAAGVLWRSGGGIVLGDSYFGLAQTGIRVEATTAGGLTGDFAISGNIFENQLTNGIHFSTASGVNLKYITVGNNAFFCEAPVKMHAVSQYGISGVSVVGNAWKGTGPFLDLLNCRDVKAMNAVTDGGTEITQSGCLNVDVY
jgi:hypothetical protein